MKKIIYVLSIIFLFIITILNIIFTAKLDVSEHITIMNNSVIYILGVLLLGLGIYAITEFVNRQLYKEDSSQKKKKRKILFILVIVFYSIFNILWIIFIRPPIVGDQIHACNLAQTFYNNNLEQFLPNMTYAGIPLSQYMQSYHQQISLAFVFSLFFRLIHFDTIELLRVLNVISTIVIVIALYKICKQLSKKYQANKSRLLFLILTFVSLPMISTFIYGDLPSLALCLFSVYFMMKFTETKKLTYPILASIFTMFAYMMRMNCLIFVIATAMYLLFYLFTDIKNRQWKENVTNIVIILTYICISVFPASFVQNYYLDKYNMDKEKAYPTVSYLLMAMEESWRGNGWYNEARGEYALKNIEKAKKEYVDEIKNRLKYFSENIGYTFEFYTNKLVSMWAENTYSAVRSNLVKENDPIDNTTAPICFYQKTLLVVTCACSLIFLIQNRKKISLDVIFLITIFIGGFAFHILWEAKSRYIIPYIIVLIPIASMKIKKAKLRDWLVKTYNNIKLKVKNYKNK